MNATSLVSSPAVSRGDHIPLLESPAMARLVGMAPLLERYRRLPIADTPGDFARLALDALQIRVQVQGERLAAMPVSGPVLLTANHPFGSVEGLILAALCSRVRPDLKILVNRMLYSVPELR